ncbi:MAG TPA: hypothetical protein VK135_06660 [Candidatus Dormibacteraeota bacterium]|nr:hypothetical protein [Candidatus Dormibacteraeota bacterium]
MVMVQPSIFTGFLEILSAIVITARIWIEPLAAIGGIRIGAIMTHVKIKDKVKNNLISWKANS